MHDRVNFHTESRNSWHTRFGASLRTLAGVELQRQVQSNPTNPGHEEQVLNVNFEELSRDHLWSLDLWIDTPEWKRCVDTGACASRLIEDTGWYTDGKLTN